MIGSALYVLVGIVAGAFGGAIVAGMSAKAMLKREPTESEFIRLLIAGAVVGGIVGGAGACSPELGKAVIDSLRDALK